MKLKLLFLTMIGSVAIANAQYTVADRSGNVLNDGDIIEYGTKGTPEDSYDFYVTNNNASETIYTRISFDEAINADGSLFELCYGLCYTGMTVGQTVPPIPNVLPIAVGETTAAGNHFQNFDGGDGSTNLDYIFTFHQYEADGVTEIGTPLTFTYRYNPTLGVNNNSRVNLSIQSTVITNELVLNVNEPVSMTVYNLQGRVVKQASFETGRQTLDMSNLNSQTYILQFNNEKGATQTSKIIIK